MKTNAYSLFDSKTLVYSAPFFTVTDGAAVRMLTDLVGDPNSGPGRHPRDYVLYMIGTYDDAKGTMLPMSPLVHVVDAIAVVPIEKQHELFGKPNGAGALDQQEKM